MTKAIEERLTLKELDEIQADVKICAKNPDPGGLFRRVHPALCQLRADLVESKRVEAEMRNRTQIAESRLEVYRDLARAVEELSRQTPIMPSWCDARDKMMEALETCIKADPAL
jgi:hypothetical protein